MKFYVDLSLGRLAKWLRLLGFDTELRRLTPHTLLPPWQDGVYFLARRSSWPRRQQRPDLIILSGDDVEAQLTALAQRLPLAPETWTPLQRCSDCNVPLRPLSSSEVEGRVPDYIASRHGQFHECPRCQRVFWEGSHQRRIRQRLAHLAGQPREGGAAPEAVSPPAEAAAGQPWQPPLR